MSHIGPIHDFTLRVQEQPEFQVEQPIEVEIAEEGQVVEAYALPGALAELEEYYSINSDDVYHWMRYEEDAHYFCWIRGLCESGYVLSEQKKYASRWPKYCLFLMEYRMPMPIPHPQRLYLPYQLTATPLKSTNIHWHWHQLREHEDQQWLTDRFLTDEEFEKELLDTYSESSS